MNNKRLVLWMALIAVSYLLWQQWQTDYHRPKTSVIAQADTAPAATTHTDNDGEIPVASAADNTVGEVITTTTPEAPVAAAKIITVETDVLRLAIDSAGGSIRSAELKNYPVEAGRATPVVKLLDDAKDTWFIAQSGLVATTGNAPDHRAQFNSKQTDYQLREGSNQLEIPLTWIDQSGVSVTKTLIFKRGEYTITQRYTISNKSTEPWRGNAYAQLQRVAPPAKKGGFSITDPQQFSFIGAAWYSPEEKFEKLAFDDFADEPFKRDISGGWAAMLQHYFLAALIPDTNSVVSYSTEILDAQSQPRFLIRHVEPAFDVEPEQTRTIESRLYLGPKLQEKLNEIAPGLGLALDYGMVRLFAEPLFRFILNPLHKLVGNWGWAIVFTTVLIKLLLYPLASAQYRSMAKMRAMQPRLEALKQRYGSDKQKYNQAMMEFYQKEKINPAGGCLPIIPQMFVFIALYWVLIESVELRHAPFFGWLTNLTAHDPYFVLPVLNALTMWVTQKMSPAPAGMDPMQQKILQYMPLAFSVIMIFFPAGLVLYWTVNGALGVAQQWWITRQTNSKK